VYLGKLTFREREILQDLLSKRGIETYEVIDVIPEGRPLAGSRYPGEIDYVSGVVVTPSTAYSFWLDWLEGHYDFSIWSEVPSETKESEAIQRAQRRLRQANRLRLQEGVAKKEELFAGPYPALYMDAFGQEQVMIERTPDIQVLWMTLRGIHFRGAAEYFYVWPTEQEGELLQQFRLQEIISASQQRLVHRRLIGYMLQWTEPQPVIRQGKLIQGTLCGTVGCVAEEQKGSLVTFLSLILQVQEVIVEAAGQGLRRGKAMTQLQQQLPPEMRLKGFY
jgi:hypothetical protein